MEKRVDEVGGMLFETSNILANYPKDLDDLELLVDENLANSIKSLKEIRQSLLVTT